MNAPARRRRMEALELRALRAGVPGLVAIYDDGETRCTEALGTTVTPQDLVAVEIYRRQLGCSRAEFQRIAIRELCGRMRTADLRRAVERTR